MLLLLILELFQPRSKVLSGAGCAGVEGIVLLHVRALRGNATGHLGLACCCIGLTGPFRLRCRGAILGLNLEVAVLLIVLRAWVLKMSSRDATVRVD